MAVTIGLSLRILAALLAVSSPVAAAETPGSTPQTAPPKWIAVMRIARPELLEAKGWTSQAQSAGAAHFEFLKDQARNGSLIIAGKTTEGEAEGRLAPDTFGLMIFEAPDRRAAAALAAQDPGVTGGIITTKVHSFDVVVTREDAPPSK